MPLNGLPTTFFFFVIGAGSNDAALFWPSTHGKGFATQFWLTLFFYRTIKGIEIEMDDLAHAVHGILLYRCYRLLVIFFSWYSTNCVDSVFITDFTASAE